MSQCVDCSPTHHGQSRSVQRRKNRYVQMQKKLLLVLNAIAIFQFHCRKYQLFVLPHGLAFFYKGKWSLFGIFGGAPLLKNGIRLLVLYGIF